MWVFESAAQIPPIANLRDPDYIKTWETVNKGWSPGKDGKGIVVDGQLYTWNTDKAGEPHHFQITSLLSQALEKGILDYQCPCLHIGASGEYTCDKPGFSFMIEQQEPRLHQQDIFGSNDESDWRFGNLDDQFAALDHPEPRLNWEEGNQGKGIIEHNGDIHTWNEDDHPYHVDFEADNPHVKAQHYLYISPEGKVSTNEGSLGPDEELRLRDADPRLHLDGFDEGPGWKFGKTRR